MKKNCTGILLVFVFLFVSCRDDKYQELSKNYEYLNNGKNNRLILSDNIILHRSIYPDVTDYAFNNSFIIVEQRPNKEGFLSNFSFDLLNGYTAYKQLLDSPSIGKRPEWAEVSNKVRGDSLIYKPFIERNVSINNTSNDAKIARLIVDSLMENNYTYAKIFYQKINYWIIVHSNDSLYGPLNRQEFLLLKRKLNVPNDLKLEFEQTQ